jgi:hypothetical protein
VHVVCQLCDTCLGGDRPWRKSFCLQQIEERERFSPSAAGADFSRKRGIRTDTSGTDPLPAIKKQRNP